MSWEPISRSLGTVIDERLSSPLTSSFVIAWSLWNYKVFFILFSARSLEYKFDAVAARFADMYFLANGVGIPLIAAIVYIYWLPIPAQKVYRVWRENQHKNDNIKAEYDNQKPISPEDARQYRQKFRDFEDEAEKFQALIQTQRADLKAAKEKITELETEILDAAKEVADSKNFRARLSFVSERLEEETSSSLQRARWVDELIAAAEIGNEPVDVEISALTNAITASMAQSGVRDQGALDRVRMLAQPIERFRRNLVQTATRISREVEFAQLQESQSDHPIEHRSREEDVVSPNPGGGFQTVVHRDIRRPPQPDT